MIQGIGTDIIEIYRVKKAIISNAFKKKCFTELELELIEKKGYITAATNFAAKEAVAKAFGEGFRNFKLKDIEILRRKNGKPYIILHNNAEKIYLEKGIKNIDVSLSHCNDYAVAFVIIEN